MRANHPSMHLVLTSLMFISLMSSSGVHEGDAREEKEEQRGLLQLAVCCA